MKFKSTFIEDEFAEAFSMRYTRIVVTAFSDRWLRAATDAFCGYGCSVIGCDAEVGVESWLPAQSTPDGRIGASLLLFGFSAEALEKALVNRIGQCVMTCPTTAVFNGLDGGALEEEAGFKEIRLGDQLRFFGDGFQKSKIIGDTRIWRIPVMDGEFIVEDKVGVARGIGGGNFLILSTGQASGLTAAERAVDAISNLPGVIAPFPGGVVRSGSKVGSRYPKLRASTSHTYCPTLRGRVESKLPDEVNAVYEIVIDGVNFDSIAHATRIGIENAVSDEVIAISAGNYGGKLGKYHFHLRELLSPASESLSELGDS